MRSCVSKVPYGVSPWFSHLNCVPKSRCTFLHHAPATPVEAWTFQTPQRETFSLMIKRDDLTECAASGNKVRKLEFIFADVLEKECDVVITVGGTGSNHCRAVAALCAKMGLECHLIQRMDRYHDPSRGLEGNLLLSNLLGAHSHLVSVEEYRKHGQKNLLRRLGDSLRAQGKKPYEMAVGGSITPGVFGYMECVNELAKQVPNVKQIFFACGSGGTAAGLAIGLHLHPLFKVSRPRLLGYCVCDSADAFYEHVQHEMHTLGVTGSARDLIEFREHSRGIGYAQSTPDEISLLRCVAQSSGVMLDATYTVKAVRGFVEDAQSHYVDRGKETLFVHTGGIYSLFQVPQNVIYNHEIQENKVEKIM